MSEISYFKVLLLTSSLLSVSVADPEVTCVYRQSCLLPCLFQFDSDPLIHWIKVAAADSLVHSYYSDRDQLGHQDQTFRNRTSLFQDQISRGNASLLLEELKIQDEGRYKCYTSTAREFRESFVNLKTEAPVSAVSISQEENRIVCSSEGIYPQPELTWSTEPPSNTALETRTTLHQNEEKLYSISSSLNVPDDGSDLTYSCTVKTQSNNRTASFRAPSKESETLSWELIGGLIAAAAVAAGVTGVLVWAVKKGNRKKQKSYPASKRSLDLEDIIPFPFLLPCETKAEFPTKDNKEPQDKSPASNVIPH